MTRCQHKSHEQLTLISQELCRVSMCNWAGLLQRQAAENLHTSAKHVYEGTEGTHDQMSAMELQHLMFVKHHKST